VFPVTMHLVRVTRYSVWQLSKVPCVCCNAPSSGVQMCCKLFVVFVAMCLSLPSHTGERFVAQLCCN
jgi:hypothetical protein